MTMAPWMNGRNYFGDITVDEARYRPPLRDRKGRLIPADPEHWEEAVRAEERAKAQAEKGELSARRQSFSRFAFSKAVDAYIEERKPDDLALLTIRTEKERAKNLMNYFGEKRLSRITADDVLAYRVHRHNKGISPRTINMELGFLRRLMKRACRWQFFEGKVRFLKEDRDKVGRA